MRERTATLPTHLTFAADQPAMARRVTVHVLTPETAADRPTLLAFYRAARLVAQIEHPNVLAIYAVSHTGTIHYAAAEHSAGWSVGSLLRDRERITSDDAIRVAMDMAEGLRAARAVGFPAVGVSLDDVLLTADRRVKMCLPLFVLHNPGSIAVRNNDATPITDIQVIEARWRHDEPAKCATIYRRMHQDVVIIRKLVDEDGLGRPSFGSA